jgi:competence protein ComEC
MQGPNVYYWKEMPFTRLLAPFMSGILCGIYIPHAVKLLLPLTLLALIILWSIHRLPAWKAWKWALHRGLAINLLLFLAGGFIVLCNNFLQFHHSRIEHESTENKTLLVTLTEPAMKKNGRYRALASLYEISTEGKKINIGKATLFFPKQKQVITLPYGSLLMINARIRFIKEKGNPGQFDFMAYYLRQGIYYQVFLKEGEYQIIAGNKGNPFNHFLFTMRNKIVQIIQHNIGNKQAAGLAEALLIGYRNDLDQSLLTAYANTGVVHVIAISGLHLGLLYAVMMMVTGLLNRNGKKKWLQFIMVIPFLWMFSLMTGGSASVIRSACMFTFLGVGQLIDKNGNPLNMLGAAAFILLIYQPNWILDTGFQLSFAAVASIMIYYDKIRLMIYFRNPAALKCWEMIAVTLSAQILTTPLVLFYFKQFPLLFLFTNLVAVPLSGWILLGALLLCFCYPLKSVATELGILLEKAIFILNDYVQRMDNIPFSVIRDVLISPVQVFALYVCIGGFTFWMATKNKIGCWILITGIFLFTGNRLKNDLTILKQQKLVVLQITGQQAILLVNGKSGILLTKKLSPGIKADIDKELEPVRRYFGIRNMQSKLFPAGSMVQIKWGGKTMLLCTGLGENTFYSPSLHADIGLLSFNPGISLKDLQQQTRCLNWVADPTNAMWKIQEWKKQAEQLHLRFHSVTESGAFIQDY